MMFRFTAVAAGAFLLTLGCTATGDTGPAGPKGDPGEPGTSVTSVQLEPGTTLICPDGGVEFTSTSGVTHVCNGAQGPKGDQGVQGIQGPPGPRLIVKTAAGETLGPMTGFGFAIPYGQFSVYIEGLGKFASLSGSTGTAHGNTVYFTEADCTGQGYVQSNASIYGVFGAGDRLFTVSNTTEAADSYLSQLSGDGICTPLVYSNTLYPVTEVLDPRYPYAAPLHVAYE